MSMPKGYKMSNGYATVEDGMDYRAISEVMTSNGYKMNHATARNVLLSAMRTFASDILISRGEDLEPDRIEKIAKSPQFQAGIAGSISDILAMRDMHNGN